MEHAGARVIPGTFRAPGIYLTWQVAVAVLAGSLSDLAVSVTTAPETKPVPVMVTERPVMFLVWVEGETVVTVGSAFTVNVAEPVAATPSPLVTVTVRAPVAAAPVMLMFALTVVALTQVVEFTVMPAPENAAASGAPLMKPVPVIAMTWLVAPCGLEVGLVEATVALGLIVIEYAAWVAPTPAASVAETTTDENVPLAVGVPEMAPVVELIDKPAGRPVADQLVNGAVPPDVDIVTPA